MRNQLMVLCAVLVMGGLYSCSKENPTPKKATISIEHINTKDGEDDQHPKIQGAVKKNGVTIQNVRIDIVPELENSAAASTNANPFEFEVADGKYYLKVTETGQSPVETDVFEAVDGMYIDVTL